MGIAGFKGGVGPVGDIGAYLPEGVGCLVRRTSGRSAKNSLLPRLSAGFVGLIALPATKSLGPWLE